MKTLVKYNERFVFSSFTILLTFILWFSLSEIGIINSAFIPTTQETKIAFSNVIHNGYANGSLYLHIVHSIKLVISGFFIAILIGIPLGLWMGYSKYANAFFGPIFSIIRPIPPIAWIPISIIFFGLGDSSKLFLIILAAFVPAVINAYTGSKSTPKHLIEASKMLGIKPLKFTTEVIVPSASIHIFTGLKLSLQASWVSLVASELVGAEYGLGRILNQAAQDIYPAMILTSMFIVALIGWVMTILLERIEKKVIRWN